MKRAMNDHPTASWKRMLVGQPPVHKLTVGKNRNNVGTRHRYHLVCKDESGCKMGQVAEIGWGEDQPALGFVRIYMKVRG